MGKHPFILQPLSFILPKSGALAQLGERLNGIQEVGGSIPPSSTFSRFQSENIGALAQLGERVVRNDEVSGSIPLSSNFQKPSLNLSGGFLRFRVNNPVETTIYRV